MNTIPGSTVTILQLTDLHVFATPGSRLKGIPTRESFADVVGFIRDNLVQFDHLVITGDFTHDEQAASYQAVRDLLGDWVGRLWLVPGNHDDRALLRQTFPERIPVSESSEIQFQFVAENWLCVGLDSHVPGQVYGRLGSGQLTWLRDLVMQNPDRKVILFLHHPPVSLGSAWMDPIGLRDMELLQQLIGESPHIQLVCCGHVHHESAHSVRQCEVVTTPSTGIQFSPAGETPTFVAGAPGFRLIELSADSWSTHVYRLPEVRYVPVTDPVT